jgi:ketosteroid isomerase-like protein
MSDETEVLRANAAFYRAFANKDADAMERAWAEQRPVACVHPGWGALSGRETVVRSWRAILTGGGAPPIRCEAATAHLWGEVALVLCTERIPGASLAATNIFVREDGAWKLAHHHASPVAQPQPRSDPLAN